MYGVLRICGGSAVILFPPRYLLCGGPLGNGAPTCFHVGLGAWVKRSPPAGGLMLTTGSSLWPSSTVTSNRISGTAAWQGFSPRAPPPGSTLRSTVDNSETNSGRLAAAEPDTRDTHRPCTSSAKQIALRNCLTVFGRISTQFHSTTHDETRRRISCSP